MKNRFRKKFTGTPHILGSGPPEGEGASNQQSLIDKLEAKKKKQTPPRVSLTEHLEQCDAERRNAPLQFSQDLPKPVEEEKADEEEMEIQVSCLISASSNENAVSLLKRILRNLILHPNEPKFQKLNLENAKVKEGIVDVPGALDFALLCGFVRQDEQLVYEGSHAMEKPRSGLELLCRHFPEPPPPVEPKKTPAAESPTPTAQTSPESVDVAPRERQTKLVLLKPTNDAVPEWFFDRTSAEVKAEYTAMTQQKARDETLMTRSQREKLKPVAKQYVFAVVRVRLPEGVLVQGEFAAGESVVRIHEWVTEQLRDATRPFELALPSRDKLGIKGTVKQCQLMPATLLSFRWTDGLGMLNNEPTVKDELLLSATVDWEQDSRSTEE